MNKYLVTLGLSTLVLPLSSFTLASGQDDVDATIAKELERPLTRALDSIQPKRIQADLHFLASDEMRGRDTPSQEQRIAARFIAARLQRLGWEPGGKDGYLWDYELPTVAIDGSESSMDATKAGESVELGLGVDYAFYPNSLSELDVSGKGLVFVGTGTKEELEGLDLEGRWTLCRHSELRYTKVSSNARKAGAVGVIVLPGEGMTATEMEQRVQTWGKQVTEGRLNRGRGNSKARPYVYMTEAGAQKLFKLAGSGVPELGDGLDVALTEKRVMLAESTAGLENVIGIWPGSDPELASELIILSAHYDHVGANSDGTVFNGADDNGSGTVGLLSVAEALKAYGPMRRSIMLIWVSGEEKGLLGSAAWTKDPHLPGGLKPVANINIDMIGRNDARSLLVTPTQDHDAYNGLTRMAESYRAEEGFDKLGSADAYWSRSDHANFSKNLQIPVAFLFSDIHEDYHKVTDTPDKIDYDKIARVSRLVVRMLNGLQADSLSL
jgi:hypothetical protein